MTGGPDPYPQRTTCPFPGCPISSEEHHRVNIGLVKENGELRKKLKDHQPKKVEVTDLTSVSKHDLIAEVARRMGIT